GVKTIPFRTETRIQVETGSCAIGAREPSQGRKAAALSGTSDVPQITWPPPEGAASPFRAHAAGLGRRTPPLGSGRGPPVALPPVPSAPLRRGEGPGARGQRPAQRGGELHGGARLPLLGAPWHGQDLHRPHPREGAQLREPPGRRAVLRV